MTTLGFYRKLSGLTQTTTRAAAQLADVSIPAASMALRRLAAEGLCTPLKKGSWLLGTAASKPGALVAAAATPYMAYLSGSSALRLHGRIQQIPEAQFAVTLGRPGRLDIPGGRIMLHHLHPGLFGGYAYDSRAEGFIASPEKALFDLAYLSAMNRSSVSLHLPETNLTGLCWKEVQAWLRRIPSSRVRSAVGRALQSLREQNAACD